MSPYYTDTNSNYPNTKNITRISKSSDYKSWLYNGYNEWYTMGSYTASDTSTSGTFRSSWCVYSNGSLDTHQSAVDWQVRPVITLVK